MAHRHPRGQIIVEAIFVMFFLIAMLFMVVSQMDISKKKFEKKDLTEESHYGAKKFHRKK